MQKGPLVRAALSMFKSQLRSEADASACRDDRNRAERLTSSSNRRIGHVEVTIVEVQVHRSSVDGLVEAYAPDAHAVTSQEARCSAALSKWVLSELEVFVLDVFTVDGGLAAEFSFAF